MDAWTSLNCIPFLGITAHWITKDWKLEEILVDFHKLYGMHSGENLAEVFLESCNELNILSKVYLQHYYFYKLFFLLILAYI